MSTTFDARRRSGYEDMKRKEREEREADEAKRARLAAPDSASSELTVPLPTPNSVEAVLLGTNVDDDQRQDDALELLDLMSPVNDPPVAQSGVSAADKCTSSTAVTGCGSGTQQTKGKDKDIAACSNGTSGVGASIEPSPAGVSPAGLLKVLDALGAPPGAAAAVSASGATFEMPSGVSAAELEAVLDMLGAPPNPNPMLEQLVLQGAKEEEVAALFVCQPVSEAVKPLKAVVKPAASTKDAKQSRSNNCYSDGINWDAPD